MEVSKLALINKIESSKGHVMILTLGVLVTLGVVMPLGLGQLTQSNQTYKSFRVVGARDSLVNQVRRYSSIGSTFRASLDPSLPTGTNSALNSCIFGGLVPCQGGVEQPISLYYPVTSETGVKSLKVLAGSGPHGSIPAQPAFYNLKGAPCAEDIKVADMNCPFEVFANFVATCTGGAASCVTAESISVRYTVRVAPSLSGISLGTSLNTLSLASVSQAAPAVTREQILPGSTDSTSGNVMVTILVIEDAEPPPDVATRPVIDPAIIAAVQAGGVRDSKIISMLALAFQAAGFTDPAFITSVTQAGIRQWDDSDKGDFTRIISAIAGAGITDVESASLIAKAGITSPSWAQIVVQSGITNAYLAGELQGAGIKTPVQLAAVVGAVVGVGNAQIAASIAKNGVTDASIANSIWSAVSSLGHYDIAETIIDGGVIDPVKITSIIKAVSGIPNEEVAEELAERGVTDPSLAMTLWNIVSVIRDEDDAAEIAASGIRDPSIAQARVEQYLSEQTTTTSNVSNSGSNSGSSTPTSTGTSSSSGSSNTTTTTSSGTGSGPKPLPASMTLISTCTTGCGTPLF
ncbi:hypothetical protein [Bdellovibrio sp. HCB337]|uniref:hypothetical protein n=1 Tax=Bdellovibrio sp. HCB337 TaxID=3394358 RepID=UPI0039A68F55